VDAEIDHGATALICFCTNVPHEGTLRRRMA
jgi:hypothetical protein